MSLESSPSSITAAGGPLMTLRIIVLALAMGVATFAGFAISQNKRKLVEKVFGWAKLDRALRQVKLRGLRRVDWLVQLVATAYNLRRMQKLLATP